MKLFFKCLTRSKWSGVFMKVLLLTHRMGQQDRFTYENALADT